MVKKGKDNTNITVSKKVHKELSLIKIEYGFDTLGQVIEDSLVKAWGKNARK